jgi:hypothetical protein
VTEKYIDCGIVRLLVLPHGMDDVKDVCMPKHHSCDDSRQSESEMKINRECFLTKHFTTSSKRNGNSFGYNSLPAAYIHTCKEHY